MSADSALCLNTDNARFKSTVYLYIDKTQGLIVQAIKFVYISNTSTIECKYARFFWVNNHVRACKGDEKSAANQLTTCYRAAGSSAASRAFLLATRYICVSTSVKVCSTSRLPEQMFP